MSADSSGCAERLVMIALFAQMLLMPNASMSIAASKKRRDAMADFGSPPLPKPPLCDARRQVLPPPSVMVGEHTGTFHGGASCSFGSTLLFPAGNSVFVARSESPCGRSGSLVAQAGIAPDSTKVVPFHLKISRTAAPLPSWTKETRTSPTVRLKSRL